MTERSSRVSPLFVSRARYTRDWNRTPSAFHRFPSHFRAAYPIGIARFYREVRIGREKNGGHKPPSVFSSLLKRNGWRARSVNKAPVLLPPPPRNGDRGYRGRVLKKIITSPSLQLSSLLSLSLSGDPSDLPPPVAAIWLNTPAVPHPTPIRLSIPRSPVRVCAKIDRDKPCTCIYVVIFPWLGKSMAENSSNRGALINSPRRIPLPPTSIHLTPRCFMIGRSGFLGTAELDPGSRWPGFR